MRAPKSSLRVSGRQPHSLSDAAQKPFSYLNNHFLPGRDMEAFFCATVQS
jgi:hypothetical protein